MAQRYRFGDWLDQQAINPTMVEFYERNEETLEVLRRVSENHDAHLVLPHEVFCTVEDGCEVANGIVPLYADEHHLSREGAKKLNDLVAPFYRP